ncbi:MAG: tripartite tricarboxylate transporter TctB family protein [Candidatus Eremiobacteraeota bacterium]|nr:tripartite tricarboxylate transporter TctB family protein [Candidatus Eremiobacteraeota bacterium]
MKRFAITYDRGVMLALIVFGVAVFAASTRIDGATTSPSDIGPLFVPRIFAGALILFAVLAILFSKPSTEDHGGFNVTTLAVAALVIAYALLLPRLGYVASTLLILMAILNVLRAGSWWSTLLFSIGMTGGLYLIFEKVLTIGLPSGPWGF